MAMRAHSQLRYSGESPKQNISSVGRLSPACCSVSLLRKTIFLFTNGRIRHVTAASPSCAAASSYHTFSVATVQRSSAMVWSSTM